MSLSKVVVHTDVFLDFLCSDREPSVLRQTMGKFFCYTTVFHAIELFALARTETEKRAVEGAMAAMKVLGLNSKTARKYGELLQSTRSLNLINVLIAGLCLDSRLPILTNRKGDFRGIKGLTVVPTKLIRKDLTSTEILAAVR